MKRREATTPIQVGTSDALKRADEAQEQYVCLKCRISFRRSDLSQEVSGPLFCDFCSENNKADMPT